MKRSPVTPYAISAVTIILIVSYFSSYYVLIDGTEVVTGETLDGMIYCDIGPRFQVKGEAVRQAFIPAYIVDERIRRDYWQAEVQKAFGPPYSGVSDYVVSGGPPYSSRDGSEIEGQID